jgi:hypothetical protein
MVKLLPEVLSSLSAVIPDIITAISSNLPLLLNSALEIVMALGDALLDNIDVLIDAGIDLVLSLGLGLIEAIPKLTDKIPEIITKVVSALTDPEMIKKLLGAGVELVVALGLGLVKAIPELLAAIPQLIIEVVKGIKEAVPQMKGVGKDLISGLWNGIKESWSSLVTNVKDLGSNLLGGIKDIFGVHSPSTEFAYIGKMCDEGLAEGLGGMKGTIADTRSMLADEMSNGFGVDTSLNLRGNLSQGSALNAASTQPTNLSAQIASAVYEALNGMALNASITGTPDSRKWFDEMRIQARLYNRKTGQEAFV